MKKISFFAAALLVAAGFLPLQAQDDAKVPGMLSGPGIGKLGTVAQVEVPTGFIFLDAKLTKAMVKKMGETPTGRELGYIHPANGDWSVFFEFDDIGYVKDDDKDKLDAAKLLDSYKRGAVEENKQRKASGEPPLEIIGWLQEPKYDTETHNLTWAIRASSGGHEFLNYNTRLLGRKGVMELVLVCEPENLTKTMPQFKQVLANHKFTTGQSYAEYKPGDKIAKVGLAALVIGGAAVGAAKLGLFAWLAVLLKKGFKLIIVAVVAVAAFFKKFFGRLFGRKSDD
ncbi:MAG: DUF2167 domain-containing protein [Pedosphaera sp.]|nr:DUF2167 domain-containing protein [Pedosphaera sp.]